MSSVEALGPANGHGTRRFAVAWRNRPKRSIATVGVLDHDVAGYRFQYLARVDEIDGFTPFVGFPDFDHVYESSRLWPFFDLRVMDRKRPDFSDYVRWLGLQADASRLDILSRSAGDQKGDTVLMAEAPTVAADGATDSVFLVRGLRYAGPEAETATVVEMLDTGTELDLVDDSSNEANPAALILATLDGARVGWVPDLLVGYVRLVRDAGGRATVVQNNGADAPWHMRLLVRVQGRIPTDSACLACSGWPWTPSD